MSAQALGSLLVGAVAELVPEFLYTHRRSAMRARTVLQPISMAWGRARSVLLWQPASIFAEACVLAHESVRLAVHVQYSCVVRYTCGRLQAR